MFVSLVKLLLAPLLLYQGKQVRTRIPKLPEASGGRSFAAEDEQGLSLLIIGDSSAAGVGAATQSEALSGQLMKSLGSVGAWRLLARSGATTASTLEELESAEPEHFDIAITVLGVNDLLSGVPISEWVATQSALRSLIRERFTPHSLIVNSLPPVRDFPALPQPLRWYLGRRAEQYSVALEKSVIEESDTYFSPIELPLDAGAMASDGFHPGPQVYEAWGSKLAELCIRLDKNGPSATIRSLGVREV